MRRTTDIPSEPMVPVSLIAVRTGQLDETIWRKLRESETVRDWDGTYCLPWSRAKQLYDEISAATAAADAENQKRIAEQQDREQFEREYPLRAYEAAAKRNVVGTQAFGPDNPEPDWSAAPNEDDE